MCTYYRFVVRTIGTGMYNVKPLTSIINRLQKRRGFSIRLYVFLCRYIRGRHFKSALFVLMPEAERRAGHAPAVRNHAELVGNGAPGSLAQPEQQRQAAVDGLHDARGGVDGGAARRPGRGPHAEARQDGRQPRQRLHQPQPLACNTEHVTTCRSLRARSVSVGRLMEVLCSRCEQLIFNTFSQIVVFSMYV